MDSDLGLLIRRRRMALGWTIAELADASGISRGTVHRAEINPEGARLATIVGLVDALGMQLRIRVDGDLPPGAAGG
jgi:transcriptional regulator with XRE-family HTH domain